MAPEQKDFSAEDSLKLIRSMIETTKTSITDSSHYFLLWGWATMIGCLTQYVLMQVIHYPHHYYAWFVTLIALLLHFIFLFKDSKKQRVTTFVSEANGYLWMAVGFSFFVMAFIFSRIGWQYSFPFYILFYGLGTSVSGALLQFKPMLKGGIACFVFAAAAAYLPYDLQILLTAVAILVSYIIPGHLLRSQYRKNRNTVNDHMVIVN